MIASTSVWRTKTAIYTVRFWLREPLASSNQLWYRWKGYFFNLVANIILHTFRMTWAKHITSSWTEGKPMIYNENIYISNASIQILHEVLQFTIYQPDDFDLCFHGTFNAKWIKDHVFEKTIVSIKMCFESRSESLVEILLHNMFHLEIWMHHKRIHCQPLYHA